MSQALISVVLPVYNSEQFIYDAVLSISNQTYKNTMYAYLMAMSNCTLLN